MFDPATFLAAPAALGGGGTGRTTLPERTCALEGYTDVRWSNRKAPAPSPWARGVKRLGIEFERRVTDVLESIYGRGTFRASPVIEYRHGRARHFAIPDGILRLSGPLGPEVVVIEVKLRHTVAVWPQLMERYAPLVRVLEPQARVRACEVCRSYDPAVNIPHTLIESLHRPPPHSGALAPLEVLKWKI